MATTNDTHADEPESEKKKQRNKVAETPGKTGNLRISAYAHVQQCIFYIHSGPRPQPNCLTRIPVV